MRAPSADGFIAGLRDLEKTLRAATRYRYSIGTHPVYAPKARAALASLRKHFLMMKRDYPDQRFPGVAFQIAAIEPLINGVVELFPSQPKEILRLVDEIRFKVDSDLAAELDATKADISSLADVPFLPGELISDRYPILQKILWEANRTYNAACYNACAAMLRRLVESLTIEAFERHGLSERIKKNAEYVEFRALIGIASAEPALRLTRNTKRVLPSLKFLGDLGAHNRMALVRKDDLDRLHDSVRAGIEELVQNLGGAF